MSIFKELKQQYFIGGVVEKLIYWNVLLFAIPYVLVGILSLFSIKLDFITYISLSSNSLELLWKPWSLFTYSFFHSDFLHILFNLIIFHFVSRFFLTFFTQKQLLSLYLLGGAFAGLVYITSYLIFSALQDNQLLIGASGAVMAILFAVATFSPNMQIRLLLIGNVKMWHIAVFYLIVDLISLSSNNVGGHLAHLGGALFGYLFSLQIKKGIDITKSFTSFMDYVVNLFKPRKSKPFKMVHKNKASNQITNKKVVNNLSSSQKQIDTILDKISKSGYDSLTKVEKDFLFRAGK